MADETKPKQPWTPGPWTFEPSSSKEGTPYQHIRSGPTAVADTWHADSITVLGWGPMSGHIQARPGIGANARLIAAAPVLAEALADLVTAFEGTQQAPDDGSSVRWVRLIRSAEKARVALDLCGWRWS